MKRKEEKKYSRTKIVKFYTAMTCLNEMNSELMDIFYPIWVKIIFFCNFV